MESTNNPVGSTDSTAWGPSSTPGKSSVRDAVVAEEYSAALKTQMDEMFSSLMSTGISTGGAYLRGLQLLYLYGLDDIALTYWEDGNSLSYDLRAPISGAIVSSELVSKAQEFVAYRNYLRQTIESTRISSSVISVVLDAVSGIGDMGIILEAILYYYILLGESNNSGGIKV